ncbi:hypothetical protein [Luteimonas sp. FCS-9]|uniref:hypothetical protein n=1 Tax=Luteimonas sp. FCS-9 TaxID=1547516 RepID=UPI00069BD304|nr:hypothetical protein [Luteimonas sp. FCS-9]
MKPLVASLSLLLLAACADAGTAPVADAPADAGAVPAPDAPDASTAPAAADATPPSATSAASDPAAFCPAGETVVFGCRSAAGVDAVCASADGGRLEYRAGQGTSAPAVVYPAAGTAPAQAFRGDTLMYSGGGGAFLRFDHDGQVHTLYTGIGRGWEKAGVVIGPAGGAATTKRSCEGEPVSQIGPALFEQAGIPKDPAGFEIP